MQFFYASQKKLSEDLYPASKLNLIRNQFVSDFLSILRLLEEVNKYIYFISDFDCHLLDVSNFF